MREPVSIAGERGMRTDSMGTWDDDVEGKLYACGAGVRCDAGEAERLRQLGSQEIGENKGHITRHGMRDTGDGMPNGWESIVVLGYSPGWDLV